jgi:hypothetical protein
MNLELLQQQSKQRHTGKPAMTKDVYKSFIAKRKPFKLRPNITKPKPLSKLKQRRLKEQNDKLLFEQKIARIKANATTINEKIGASGIIW